MDWTTETLRGGALAVKMRGRKLFELEQRDAVLGIEIAAMLNAHTGLVGLVMQAAAPGGIGEGEFVHWVTAATRELKGCPGVGALSELHRMKVRVDDVTAIAEQLAQCVCELGAGRSAEVDGAGESLTSLAERASAVIAGEAQAVAG